MPAHPVWTTQVSVVGEGVLGLLQQIVVGLIEVGSGSVRIAKRQVNARRIRWRSAGRDCKRRYVVSRERVSVWTTVIRVLIVNLVFQDRDGALLAGQEVHVRSDDVDLAAAGNCRVVVQSGGGATDVVPLADYIDRLREVDSDTRVARSIDAVVTRIAAEHGWTNFNNWRRASRIRGCGCEVRLIIVRVGRAVFATENWGRVAG